MSTTVERSRVPGNAPRTAPHLERATRHPRTGGEAAPPAPVSPGWVSPDGTPVPSPRTLVLDVIDASDPVRFARVVSSMVNTTAMALGQVVVAGVPVYPVPVSIIPRDHRRQLTLWMRDGSRALDRAVQDQVVEIVSSAYRVVAVRRER